MSSDNPPEAPLDKEDKTKRKEKRRDKRAQTKENKRRRQQRRRQDKRGNKEEEERRRQHTKGNRKNKKTNKTEEQAQNRQSNNMPRIHHACAMQHAPTALRACILHTTNTLCWQSVCWQSMYTIRTSHARPRNITNTILNVFVLNWPMHNYNGIQRWNRHLLSDLLFCWPREQHPFLVRMLHSCPTTS